MKEKLTEERAEIVKAIEHNESLIRHSTDQIYLLKRKLKLTDKFLEQINELEKEETNKPE